MLKTLVLFLIFEFFGYFLFSALNAIFFPEDKTEDVDPNRYYFSKRHFKNELTNISIENVKGFLKE